MFFLTLFFGAFIPTAFADTLETAGNGGAGVSAMWAQICAVLPCVSTGGAGGRGLVTALANAAITFIFPLIAVVAVCMVMYAGILIVTSNGSEDKISEAKKVILYASAGVILSLLTSAVVGYLTYYLNIILS